MSFLPFSKKNKVCFSVKFRVLVIKIKIKIGTLQNPVMCHSYSKQQHFRKAILLILYGNVSKNLFIYM
jgi:hypothetical protein